ncbi:MAG: ATP-binding cassette domain-containing protein [Holosporaceae bacterium]|jgi:polar amino acid transport system ATP-binding protein|nr:ATP-binding cassette domain-containing protein [Holosporaceae bacterium]
MLKIHNLCKKFNSEKVLDNINLTIKKTEIIGLAGASGGGKSTLLRCIQGLEIPTSGTVECDGKIGFMFQDFQLFPHMTVLQNIIYSPTLKDREKNYEEKAITMLNKLGIATKASEYPYNLSGGQKQRVALARSLMISPNVLLCDEPTSGLDVNATNDIVNLLKNVQESDITMIIASHNLEFLSKISDRIILLKNGKVAADIDAHKEDAVNQLMTCWDFQQSQ